MILKQRCDRAQEAVEQLAEEARFHVGQLDLAAFFHSLKIVLLDPHYLRVIVYERAALKVQVQAAVVHIDSADNTQLIVADIAFCHVP